MIVIPRLESLQYDGTNAEELASWVDGGEVLRIAEDGELTLSVTSWGLTYEVQVPISWWSLRSNGMHQGSMSPEQYERIYYELPGT